MIDLQKVVNDLEKQVKTLAAQYAADKRELLAEIEYRKTRAINLGLSFDQAEQETAQMRAELEQAQFVGGILQEQVNALTERLKAYEPEPIEDVQPVEDQPNVES